MNTDAVKPSNFIEDIIEEDLRSGTVKKVVTRFPPEPNGYLHIGHAKAIIVDFSAAEKFGGQCNLRFDDTNPVKEDTEYVESIQNDIHWLGFDWAGNIHYTSDYFDRLYEYAVELIRRGKAYVCDLSAEEISQARGTLTQPGQNSPYRNRSVEENLALFAEMKAGKYQDGAKTLRAKIDMASPNLNMRDPVIYRILHAPHHRTGDQWCIYPMYDYAHPMSDAIEGITHSLCTLEFEDHRPIYDWFLEALDWPNPPRQYEFARLNLTGTVMSKRNLRHFVTEHMVSGWDDPRMPTLSGLRRRGYTSQAIRDFCHRIGVAKSNSLVEMALLEHCIREDLKPKAHRRMAVLRPIELVITNYPEGKTEEILLENNAENPELGSRSMSFSGRVYIESEDFSIDPPPKYKRLAPGREVRLMGAYIVKCTGYETDDAGLVTKVLCEYDPQSHSGECPRKVKGVLHWVDANACEEAEIRLYAPLITQQEDGESGFNEASLEIIHHAKVESALQNAAIGEQFQFIRQGYYCLDPDTAEQGRLIFNRVVGLKDSWAKMQK